MKIKCKATKSLYEKAPKQKATPLTNLSVITSNLQSSYLGQRVSLVCFTDELVGDEQGSVAPPASHKSLSQALDEAVSWEMRCLRLELGPAGSGNMDSVPHRGSSTAIATFSPILYLAASVTSNQPTCTSTSF